MGQPHKWAKEIKAWADGETIQCKHRTEDWHDMPCNPSWEDKGEFEYRVKPRIRYPETKMTDSELTSEFYQEMFPLSIRRVANAAIRCAIEDGQVKLP